MLYSNGNSITISSSIGQAENSNIAFIEGESEIILNYYEFVFWGEDDNSIGIIIYNKNEINGIQTLNQFSQVYILYIKEKIFWCF